MKLNNYLQIIFFLLFCTKVDAQVMEFDQQSHTLGKINLSSVKDSVIYSDFKFTNTGDKPLRIAKILATCGCTTSSWSKDSYEPGERGTIRLNYKPHLRNEWQVTMHVDVYTNSLNSGTQKGIHNLKMNFELEGEFASLAPHYNLEEGVKLRKQFGPTDVYTTILERVAFEFQDRFKKKDDQQIELLAATMREGGYWQYIDYSCFFKTNWEPVKHLENLRTMATAYVTSHSDYYGSPSLFEMINDGLIYWDLTNPTSFNWWYNDIGGSQVLVDILALLSFGEENIDEGLLNNLCVKLSKSDPNEWTGANKLDIARHHLYRGCLLRDDSILKSSAEQIFFPVRITREEGIQEDMSYQQHGAQLYMGGYGIVFVVGIAEMAYILNNTPYSLSEEQLTIFSRFLRDGFFKVFRGPYIDFSVTGRGISRKNSISNRGLISVINKMIEIDPEHKKYYAQTRRRFEGGKSPSDGVEDENILFPRSDYMVHNTPKYQATVRSASIRSMKTERGNGENLLGTFLADGAFNIRQQGDEYLNIFPIWEWNKIPGVTSSEEIPPIPANWGVVGSSRWTGGVSDGEVGAFAYKHNDHGFEAIKGWFFWEEMVVALGAGITSEKMALHTTLDQSHLRSKVTYKESQKVTVDTITTKLSNPEYIIHDKMAYIPLQEATMTLRASTQSGNWIDINYNQPNIKLKKEVFNLVWEHPKGDVDASYSYIQLPSCISTRHVNAAKKSIEFINNSSLQAVYKQSSNKAMAIFYEKGSYEVGRWTISVTKPSLLIIDGAKRGNEIKVTAVNLKGDSKPVDVKLRSETVVKELKLATHEMQPSTVTFNLKE